MSAGNASPQDHFLPARLRARAAAIAAVLATLLLAIACGDNVESQLAKVRSMQEAGQFDPSIAPLRKLLASNSNHPEANYRLGIALVQTGRPSLAVWPLQKASESDEYAIQAGLLLATTLAGNKAQEEAIRAASRVLELEPDNFAALYTRAHAQLQAGHPEKTLEDADRMLKIRPTDTAAATLRGGALVDLDRKDEAEQAFKDLLANSEAAADPNDAARKCAALATFYRSQNDVRRARETYQKCIAKYPTHPLLQQWVSDFFIEIDEPDAAIKVWRRAVAATPEDLGLRGKLADLLESQGRHEEANQVLREAVELFDTPQAWRMLANQQRKQGDPKAAREALEEAMERTQEVSAPMRFALADMLIEEGEFDRAEEIANSIEEPSYKHLLNGGILLARGDPKGALEQFEAGLRLWPNNAGARYLAGRAAQELGDQDRALAEYREAVRVGETETDAALRMAEIHFSMGQFKPALQFAERHIRVRPYVEPTAHIIAARSAMAMNDPQRAEKMLRNLRARDSDNPAAYVEFAAVKRKLQGSEAAIEVIGNSELDLTVPANSDLLRALLSDYISVGQSDKALEKVSAAVAANPDSAKLLDLQARVLLKLDRESDAVKAIDKALAIEPDFAPAIELEGSIARQHGDFDGALALYARAAEKDPKAAEYIYLSAQTYVMMGEPAKSVDLLHEALEVDPSHVGANNDLAWILASSGKDLDRALELAQRAVRFDRSAETLDTLGYVHLQKGDNEEAVSVLGKALEARPDSPSIEYRLGVALAGMGDKEEARAILTKALEAPAFPEADAARAELAKLQDS